MINTYRVTVTQGTIKPRGGVRAPFTRVFTVRAKTARSAVKAVRDAGISADKVEVIKINPTLTFPIKSRKQLSHLFEAQKHLSRAGVHFDSGSNIKDGKPVTRDWELDYSLTGARLHNPNLHIKEAYPYGAPMLHVRGKATFDPAIRAFLKYHKFHWDPNYHAWVGVNFNMDRKDIRDIPGNQQNKLTPDLRALGEKLGHKVTIRKSGE